MTNKSISQLANGAAVSSTDLFPDVQTVGVGPVKVTAAQIGEYVLTGSGLTGILPVARGGTGLSTMTAANNALYSTSSSTVAAGTLPVAAGGTGLTSLTAGYIPFGNGTSAFGSNSALFWDNANSRLGIANTSPSTALDVKSAWAGGVGCFRINGYASQQFNGMTLAVDGTAGTYFYHENTNSYTFLGATTGNALVFATNSNGTTNERLRIDSSGNVGIGTSSLTGMSLKIGKSLTGATTSAQVSAEYTILSDVTSNAQSFVSSITTAAAAFALNNLYHYRTYQGTIGAGSSVTNQYGFQADSSLTGATNNYGFYSNIASGTGRWNFYAAGTADNYFAGPVQHGAGSASAPSISVFGDTDTGIFFPAANMVSIGTFGTERIRVDGSKLGVSAGLTLGSGNGYSGNTGATASGELVLYDGSTGATTLRNTGAFPIIFATNNQERMRIDSAGLVGIGATPVTGSALYIGTNSTGATSTSGIRFNQTVLSDVTNNFRGIQTGFNTQGSAFTLSNLIHVYASQGTFNSPSVVTNQYGFYVESTLTGATNNYGFYSNIASGTGRWNFYANGTADNYFAGNVGIGTNSFGTSAATVLGIKTGTAPTTGPADTIQIYSTDLSAGNTMLSLYTEGTPVNANTTAAATHRIAIRVNGTVYYLLANTSA